MSRTSIISHSANQQLVVIRQDYLAICEGNHCAAALLNVFEYWTNIKVGSKQQARTHNEILTEGGKEQTQDEELWIYKSNPDFQSELMGLFAETKIRKALKMLEQKHFITTRNNPKYGWDRRLQYLLQTDNVIASLHTVKITDESVKNNESIASKRTDASRKNNVAISEITTETTTKIVADDKRQRQADPQFDLIEKIWNTSAGGFISCLQGMIFSSKKVKGQWEKCKISPPATLEELTAFEPYAKERMPKDGKEIMPTAAVTIQRYFLDFRTERAKKLAAPRSAPIIPDTPPATPEERAALLDAMAANRPEWEKEKATA